MDEQKPKDDSAVLGGQNSFDSYSLVLGGLQGVRNRLQSNCSNQKVDALLDALQYGHAGIEVVAQALGDRRREVRQSAFLLLSDTNEDVAKQAIWNHLPWKKMHCLQTLTEFNLDCYAPEQHHPDYFAIANYNNTLLCYWDLTYKQSSINIWDLETLQRKIDFTGVFAHEFGLGKQGKVCILSFQHLAWALETETQKHIGTYPNCLMRVVEPNYHGFAVCPTKEPLFATGSYVGRAGKLEIWGYETYTRRLYYQFEDMVLYAVEKSLHLLEERFCVRVSPLLFSPDGRFLVARFQQRTGARLQLWESNTGELLHTIDNLPVSLTSYALAIDSNGQILACGTREDKVCVWELISDCILYNFFAVAPCLMSNDGRVLIYCTDSYEIVIWDLATNSQLQVLQGHTAPIAYMAMSDDREFVASYSIDRAIKIWGVSELLS